MMTASCGSHSTFKAFFVHEAQTAKMQWTGEQLRYIIPSATVDGQSKSTNMTTPSNHKVKKKTRIWEKTPSAYLGGTAEVIVIDLFYGLKVDDTLQLGLMFVCREEKYISLVKNWSILTWLENSRRTFIKPPTITTRDKLQLDEEKSRVKLWSWPVYSLWWWMKKTSTAFFSFSFLSCAALIVFSDLTAFLRYSGTSLQFVSSATAELQ